MKAVRFYDYGSPDVLRLEEVEKPSPKDNEVLIKVHAVSANPLDWHIMRGEPFLARLEYGLRKPSINKLGADMAGVVEAVGKDVTEFKPGDAVFGSAFEHGLGGFAEYAVLPESMIALKPNNVAFEAAAATPVAALTALQGLQAGGIKAGQKVLVNGASGGVGSFAVQIARAFNAEVTGVCSTRNLDLVRSIGAEHLVDYSKDDFTKNGQYDLIFDAVGNRSASDYARALKPNGICVVAGFTNMPSMLNILLGGLWISSTGSKKVGMMKTVSITKDDLLFMKTLLEAKKVVPLVDRCYNLDETANAIRYLEEGHARGKVVVQVERF